MATGMTLAVAQEMLDLWIGADRAVASGQSYTIGGRSLTRANAQEITEKIKFYSSLVGSLSRGNGGARIRAVILRDT